MTEHHHIISAGSVGELLSLKSELLSREYGFEVVFLRYFLSERAQLKELPHEEGAVSYVVQPPMGGGRIALWVYLVSGADVSYSDGATCVLADGLEHRWISSMYSDSGDSYSQTCRVFDSYSSRLTSDGCSLSDNCVRTWIFVDDIDNNYQGMVRGRREFFEKCGLTPQTHYIASTGICGGSSAGGNVLVQMDAYSIKGDFRQHYLYGRTHLNPTCEYGVTFERGVCLEYSGKSHVLISGTASIDNKGNVVHVGDVKGQTVRMLENVEVLLAEGGCCLGDVRMALIYIRSASDYAVTAPLIAEKLGNTPYVITLAPVCRPQWLIEMECIAIREL